MRSRRRWNGLARWRGRGRFRWRSRRDAVFFTITIASGSWTFRRVPRKLTTVAFLLSHPSHHTVARSHHSHHTFSFPSCAVFVRAHVWKDRVGGTRTVAAFTHATAFGASWSRDTSLRTGVILFFVFVVVIVVVLVIVIVINLASSSFG